MAELKATNVLIALLLVTLVVGVLIGFVAKGSTKYNTEFNNETYATYNSLQDINEITEEIQNRTENVGARSGVFDIIGGFFSDAYQSLKLTQSSYSALGEMTDQSAQELNLGNNTNLFKAVITTIIIITIILGILIAAIIKRNL